MKLNPDFVVHNTGEETLLVPTARAPFHGLVQGNKTLDVILGCLQTETTEEAIVAELAARFHGDAEFLHSGCQFYEMREDVAAALAHLRKIGALEE